MKAIMCAFFPFKQYVDTTQHKTHEPHIIFVPDSDNPRTYYKLIPKSSWECLM